MTTPDAASAPRLLTRGFVALSLAELAYFSAVGALIPLVPLFADAALALVRR